MMAFECELTVSFRSYALWQVSPFNVLEVESIITT